MAAASMTATQEALNMELGEECSLCNTKQMSVCEMAAHNLIFTRETHIFTRETHNLIFTCETLTFFISSQSCDFHPGNGRFEQSTVIPAL